MDADETLQALVDAVPEKEIKQIVEKAAQELAIALIAHSTKKRADGADYSMEMDSKTIPGMRYKFTARLEPVK
jgi:ribosomal protein L12E/L44/L45/RPP1/RPP2